MAHIDQKRWKKGEKTVDERLKTIFNNTPPRDDEQTPGRRSAPDRG
jgi:hypothetical protein